MDDNSILLDITTLEHKVHNRTKGKLRLYLGEFINGEFVTTVDTIKHLNEEEQSKIKEHIMSIVDSF